MIPNILRKIFFSRETHLWLNNFMNKPNLFFNDAVSVNENRYLLISGGNWLIWMASGSRKMLKTTCHSAHQTIHLPYEKFGELSISRNGPVNYPSGLCDSALLNQFLCGYIKSLAYKNKPASSYELQRPTFNMSLLPFVPMCVKKSWKVRINEFRIARTFEQDI